MAERKNFSRYNMRCGILLRAPEGQCRITDLSIPELDSRYLALTGNDIPGNNTFSFLSGNMPIIAKETLSYPGQIVLALFAPDYESASLMMRNIKLETEHLADAVPVDVPDSLEYSWGERQEEESRYKEVTSHFTLEHIGRPTRRIYSVTAWLDGANMHIEAPTEWVELVRETVEKATGYPKRNITVHTMPYTARHDEYLIEPAILAAIAATAAIRSGLPSEIRTEGMYSRPEIKVDRTTETDEDGKPVYETAVMTVDQGAFLFASEEYQRQAMTGLIPPYPLKAFRASVRIASSSNYPAAFCGSLGYSEALAATEYHISRLADKSGVTPALYRLSIEKEKRKFTDYIPGYDLEETKKCIKKAADEASYDRKWAANSFQKDEFGLLGYLRGVGISSGVGISGFSTTLSKELGFSLMMTFTQKHNVTVNTSALNHPGTIKIWKDRIAERIIPGRPEGVMFLDHGPDTIDTGPDVLSRLVASLTPQLESAAKRLSVLKDTEKLPVSIRLDAENTYYPCEFENSGCGAIVAEIIIEKESMIPVARNVWAAFAFPTIMDETSLRNSIKRTIMMTLSENGMRLPADFSIHLDISETGTEDTVASVQQLARGLTLGAAMNALAQALGEKAVLPINAERINRIFTTEDADL